MVLPAIPVVLAGAAKALGSAAVRKMLKQGVSQAVIRKKGAKEASKKGFKKLKRRQRERAEDQKFLDKPDKEIKRMMREEEEKIRSIAEGGMRNPRLFGLKMQAGGKVTDKSKKIKGKIGTQSGKAEDIDARIKKLDERFPRNRVGVIPSPGLRNERKKLDALQRKKLGIPEPKSRAEREKLKLLEEKIAKLKVKGKAGTQSGKAQDAKVRLEQLKKKYPTASKFNRVLEDVSSSIRDYHKEKGRLSKIGKRQKKEAEVRKDNTKADAFAREIAGLRDDLPKKDREKKRAEIKSSLQDSFARIRGESKAQSSIRGGMKAGGRVKKMKAGGMVKKMDGIAIRGKTKGRLL
jgi:hypothetical protein